VEVTGTITPEEPPAKQKARAAIAKALAALQKGGDFLMNWPELGSDASGVMRPVPGTPEDAALQAKRPRSGLGTVLFGDQQINTVVRDFYKDSSFSRDSFGNINLWKLYNLLTGANKSSYIEKIRK
jgi:hypothetical protein